MLEDDPIAIEITVWASRFAVAIIAFFPGHPGWPTVVAFGSLFWLAVTWAWLSGRSRGCGGAGDP